MSERKKRTVYSPQFESIDIDTPEDRDFAVVAARYMLEQKGALV